MAKCFDRLTLTTILFMISVGFFILLATASHADGHNHCAYIDAKKAQSKILLSTNPQLPAKKDGDSSDKKTQKLPPPQHLTIFQQLSG